MHNSVFFKSLLKRVCFMEELLHSFFKERKKQISLVSPLLKKKSGINVWFNKKRLIHSLEEERDLMMVVIATYKKEARRRNKTSLEHRTMEKRVCTPSLGGSFWFPAEQQFHWLYFKHTNGYNKSSKNYKKLLDLVK